MIAPDDTTFEYLKGRPHAPEGADWDAAVEYWRTLRSDDDAVFDTEVTLRASDLEPFVTWGTNPGQGLPISATVPVPEQIADENERVAAERAIEYMGLTPGQPLREIPVDTVFIGSCTNGRIEDLRSVAKVVQGKKKADGVRVLVVPASARVRLQAEAEGLDQIFLDFGAEWRNAGCSMCLGMNPDQLQPGERAASTSNRNFEGRQGKGGRTHLVSPLVAAATALRARCRRSATSTCPRAPTSRPSTARRSRRSTRASSCRSEPAAPRRPPVAPKTRRGSVMEKFTTHTGVGVPLRRSNVDTDQIIPAVYLKRVTRTGFEDALFAAWRGDPTFVLNQDAYRAGSVLVAGPDFGTGSSREHAVWALKDYGFRVVLASRFADIFRGNSGKQGLVAGIVAQEDVELLWKILETNPGTEVTVDLVARTASALDVTVPFQIDDYTRWRLMEGLDDIGLTLQHADEISAFEATRASWRPKTLPAKTLPKVEIEAARPV